MFNDSLFCKRTSRWPTAATAVALLALSACGGGMSNNMAGGSIGMKTPPASCMAASCAPMVMTMTDARGDFLSYIVNLSSLQLKTAAGAAVETVPVATKVDFAQLVDLSEIVSAGQIPAGEYVSATLTLDYTNANITADDGAGNAVALSAVDANNAPLAGMVMVSVRLDNAHHLKITPGTVGRLAFDFNLAASNTVNLAAATVTVSPTLVASVVPADDKPLRVRGSLDSVNAAQHDFVLDVRPFHESSMSTGQITAQVTPTTTYQIDGKAYAGDAGLTALAALPAATMVAAFGALQTGTQDFTATTVIAGDSLEDPQADLISGTVISRDATSLTVRGATWSHRGSGDFEFERHDVTVSIGPNTLVTERGMTGAFTVADISVGQHVAALGTATATASSAVTGPTVDSDGRDATVSLDATAGQVRLEPTSAWGIVSSTTAGSVTVNLQSLDGYSAGEFNFAGTGASAATDAQAGAYVVNTGSLSLSGLSPQAPARFIGFVTPFGSAPPDFAAQTLVSFESVTAALVVDWADGGSPLAFTGLTSSSTALQLDLTNVGDRHFVQLGPEQIDLTGLASPPTLMADSTATSELFSIGHQRRNEVENFNSFAPFVAALAGEVSGTMNGSRVVALAASGTFDSASNVFTATRIAVLIND